MWLCLKWHTVHGCMVCTERVETAAVSCGTSHVSAVSTYTTSEDIQKRAMKTNHSHASAVSLLESGRRIALYKSDQQQQQQLTLGYCSYLCTKGSGSVVIGFIQGIHFANDVGRFEVHAHQGKIRHTWVTRNTSSTRSSTQKVQKNAIYLTRTHAHTHTHTHPPHHTHTHTHTHTHSHTHTHTHTHHSSGSLITENTQYKYYNKTIIP